MSTPLPVVGLVPAAGQASRLGPLPCSKEIYPVGEMESDGAFVPKVASHYLLEKMERSGVENVYVVLREGKWDIPAYWGDGYRLDLNIAYLMMRIPYGVPFTLDQAYSFVRDRRVAMGFPDILFAPEDAFAHLLRRQEETDAPVVLGLFPARQPSGADMVEVDEEGRLRSVFIKPEQTDLTFAWICAVWTPAFTEYLHSVVTRVEQEREVDSQELYVGHVLQRALEAGFTIETVSFPKGHFTDIGTPDALRSETVSRGGTSLSTLDSS